MFKFRKYEEAGAYHWHGTYSGGWRRSSPVLHARYDVLVRAVERALDIRREVGLDVGCGDGVMLYKLARRGGRAVGLDLEYDGVSVGQRELRRVGPEPALVCGSGYRLPFADGSFGYVVSTEVLEHLDDPRTWLSEIRRVLKPGGVLALTTPHRLPSGQLQDPYHVQEYDGPMLQAELAPYFDEVEVRGQYPRALYDPYTRPLGFRPVNPACRTPDRPAA